MNYRLAGHVMSLEITIMCNIQIESYPTFQELVEQVVHNLDGSYALVFKSSLYPGEVVAARYVFTVKPV